MAYLLTQAHPALYPCSMNTHSNPITATADLIVEGAYWFGHLITRVEDANAYGHYPNRFRISYDGQCSHVTLGATYSGPFTAIV